MVLGFPQDDRDAACRAVPWRADGTACQRSACRAFQTTWRVIFWRLEATHDSSRFIRVSCQQGGESWRVTVFASQLRLMSCRAKVRACQDTCMSCSAMPLLSPSSLSRPNPAATQYDAYPFWRHQTYLRPSVLCSLAKMYRL